uniref:Uncharacterized protein n=1 Tax=Opuntia streptacantha TaxID=393608 RepID=A0A7C9EK13_OPUST
MPKLPLAPWFSLQLNVETEAPKKSPPLPCFFPHHSQDPQSTIQPPLLTLRKSRGFELPKMTCCFLVSPLLLLRALFQQYLKQRREGAMAGTKLMMMKKKKTKILNPWPGFDGDNVRWVKIMGE